MLKILTSGRAIITMGDILAETTLIMMWLMMMMATVEILGEI